MWLTALVGGRAGGKLLDGCGEERRWQTEESVAEGVALLGNTQRTVFTQGVIYTLSLCDIDTVGLLARATMIGVPSCF